MRRKRPKKIFSFVLVVVTVTHIRQEDLIRMVRCLIGTNIKKARIVVKRENNILFLSAKVLGN